jgi:hypothetical protein
MQKSKYTHFNKVQWFHKPEPGKSLKDDAWVRSKESIIAQWYKYGKSKAKAERWGTVAISIISSSKTCLFY